MIKVVNFKDEEEIQKYYDEDKEAFVFKEKGKYIELVKFDFQLDVFASIYAHNIKARGICCFDIHVNNIECSEELIAEEIFANNIKAYEISARNVNATNINVEYETIVSRNIVATNINSERISARKINAININADEIECDNINIEKH